jgi:FAD/FMN-containing dehydrogenase
VFGEVSSSALPIVRNLKQAFDPAGRLNGGRWVAGL